MTIINPSRIDAASFHLQELVALSKRTDFRVLRFNTQGLDRPQVTTDKYHGTKKNQGFVKANVIAVALENVLDVVRREFPELPCGLQGLLIIHPDKDSIKDLYLSVTSFFECSSDPLPDWYNVEAAASYDADEDPESNLFMTK